MWDVKQKAKNEQRKQTQTQTTVVGRGWREDGENKEGQIYGGGHTMQYTDDVL